MEVFFSPEKRTGNKKRHRCSRIAERCIVSSPDLKAGVTSQSADILTPDSLGFVPRQVYQPSAGSGLNLRRVKSGSSFL
jgi:hypothetical protein